MTGISNVQLHQSVLSYASFRIACLATIRALTAAKGRSPVPHNDRGFMSEVPLLDGTAPQIQLERLGDTWRRGCRLQSFLPTLEDEVVIFCALRHAARQLIADPYGVKRLISSGPKELGKMEVEWLAVRLRTLEMTLPLEAAIKASRPLSVMDSAPSDRYNGTVEADFRHSLFKMLGRWLVGPQTAWQFEHLLSRPEILDLSHRLSFASGQRDPS